MSDERFDAANRCPYCDSLLLRGPPCCPALADDLAKRAAERPAPAPSPPRQYMTAEQIEAFAEKLEGKQ